LTINETELLMEMITDVFPVFANSDTKLRTETWATVLEKYPFELCAYAVRKCFETSKFVPTLAEILDIIKLATDDGNDNAMAAWNALRRAASRASTVTQEEFDALPPEVQRFCGNLGGLRNYGMMDTAQLDTVTQSNFLKRYDGLKRSREIHESMPEKIRGLIQQVSQNKAMPAAGVPAALAAPQVRPALPAPAVPAPDMPRRTPYEQPDADEWERLRQVQLDKLRTAGITA
jgi:hypothetical protein